MSRRKVLAHALFHSQRHWAQLATLVRAAGFPSGFRGDLLFSLGTALARQALPQKVIGLTCCFWKQIGTAPACPGWA